MYLLETLLLVTLLLLGVTSFLLFQARAKIKELSEKPPQTNSQELTDFLTDIQHYKYGFVRVDPGSVFVRSPRE
jgi:hypothetical protein